MKDSRKLYNLIKKIKNKELLTEEDLIIFATLLAEEKYLNLQGIELFDQPAYDIANDILLVNGDIKSDWIKSELAYFYDGMLIAPHLESKKKLEKIRTEDFNIVMLNAMAHEMRHAYQQRLLKYRFRGEEDITLLRNLYMSLKKNYFIKNLFYHDYLYYEYDADLNAAFDINKFNEIYLNMDLTKYNELAAYKILRAYTNPDLKKQSTPIINNKLIIGEKMKTKNQDLFAVKDYLSRKRDTDETIFNGGNISKELLEELRDIYMGDTKVKNIEKVLK